MEPSTHNSDAISYPSQLTPKAYAKFSLKNRYRLYITLNTSNPDDYISTLHWGLLFAPPDSKTLNRNNAINDSLLYHVQTTREGTTPWTFEARPVNHLLSHTLVARILIGKFTSGCTAIHLSHILSRLPIEQNDPSFNCRAWAMEGVHALRIRGMIHLKVPMPRLEETIFSFARKHQQKMVERRISGKDKKNTRRSAVLDLREL